MNFPINSSINASSIYEKQECVGRGAYGEVYKG